MKSAYTLMLSIFILQVSLAQECPNQVDSLIIGTGYNPVTSTVQANYAMDPMWRLTQAPPDPAGWVSNIGGPTIVIPISSSWQYAGGNSKYLNAYPTNQALTDNWSSTTTAYIYERSFCLCENENSDSVEVLFDLSLNADNWAELQLEDVNGNITTLVSQPFVYSTANFQNTPSTATVSMMMPAGTHTLKLYHRNRLVAMGVNLSGTIYSDYLVSDTGCTNNGSLGGYLYRDANGNGVREVEEEGIADFEVQLLNSQKHYLSSIVTDNAGFYFFMDVPKGDYYLRVVPHDEWLLATPSDSLTSVTVTSAEIVELGLEVGSPVGITSVNEAPFTTTVFPNPNGGDFEVRTSAALPAGTQITITNLLGAVVQSLELSSAKDLVSFIGLESGVYFLSVRTAGQIHAEGVSHETGATVIQRVVVE